MRISDRTTARNYLKYMNKAQSSYAKTNEQIFSGNRFTKISDDVSSGTRVMRYRMDLYENEKHLDGVNTAYDELSSTETSLTGISDILTEVHSTKLVKAMNEPTQSGRDVIAAEIKAYRREILQYANLKLGKRFVFGGSNASYDAPFKEGADGRIQYNGIPVDDIYKDADGSYRYKDAGGNPQKIPMDDPIYLDVGLGIKMSGANVDPNTGFQLSYSGLDILGFGKDANGESNNIYNQLVDIENCLRNYDKDKLGKLDARLVEQTEKFRVNITDIGSKTHFLETMQTRLESTVDSYKTRIDNLMGTDEEEAATTLKMNDYVLKAVLSMGARILPTSLMDFLR